MFNCTKNFDTYLGTSSLSALTLFPMGKQAIVLRPLVFFLHLLKLCHLY